MPLTLLSYRYILSVRQQTCLNIEYRDVVNYPFTPVLPHFPWLRKLWADGGYTGADFAAWVKTQRPKLAVEVIKRSDDVSGFKVLPKRWVVERTFGWLMQHRRLVRDYEATETSATGFIFLTLVRLMLRRLA